MPLRPELTPDAFHRRQQGTLPERYGLRVLSVEEGRLRSELTIAPWMHAPNGFLHAASVILLADTTAGYATMAHLPDGASGFTTIELKTNFLGTALDGTIACECEAEHLGRTTQVWSAIVFAPSGKRMALFRCTQLVLV
jgi:1,4-dihydroxy-2-naphthoyl-CoA hydrolase